MRNHQWRTKRAAIGYVRKEDNGHYTGSIKTLSIRAAFRIVSKLGRRTDARPNFGFLTQGVEISAGWIKEGETPGKE